MAAVPAMTESEFQAVVVDLARTLGWVVYHVPDSRRATARGCPDLIMIHERQRRLLFAELKRESGKVSAEQAMWLRVLDSAGAETALWRPSDLPRIPGVLNSVKTFTRSDRAP